MSTPMGRIVKQVSENTTKYYWYPGDKKEWIRAGAALGAGAAALGIVYALTHHALAAVVVGACVTAVVAGLNFGRRDARALAGFPDLGDKAARRAAVAHTGRAAWRGVVEGFGGAAAAVVIINLPHRGLVADWLLPVVPAVVGALAHQAGMLYEQLSQAAKPASPAAGNGATASGNGATASGNGATASGNGTTASAEGAPGTPVGTDKAGKTTLEPDAVSK